MLLSNAEARETEQWIWDLPACGQTKFDVPYSIWLVELYQDWSLSSELVVNPDYHRLYDYHRIEKEQQKYTYTSI